MYFCFKSVCVSRGLNLCVLCALCLSYINNLLLPDLNLQNRLHIYSVTPQKEWFTWKAFCQNAQEVGWYILQYLHLRNYYLCNMQNSCKLRWQVISFPAKETQSQSDRLTVTKDRLRKLLVKRSYLFLSPVMSPRTYIFTQDQYK